MLQFATPLARHQAQVLLQPALIRVIDNIRKQLDHSAWAGTYKDELIWPAVATAEQKQQYLTAQAMLDKASPEEYDQIQAVLNQLPQPQHRYRLCLQKDDQQREIDLWQLCYQICSSQYDQAHPERPIEIDTTLFDKDLGDVDWIRLDEKAKQLIADIFQSL
jgi:hypothetical protein